jgi:Tol biopolymer transport system component
MLLVLLAALLAIAVWFVASSQRRLPAPFGPAANGSLLYSSDDDILIADTARSGERVIVPGPAVDSSPRWSRDGSKLTFLRTAGLTEIKPNSFANQQDVVLVDADGTNPRTLTRTPLVAPKVLDWSPDGTHVAVAHRVGDEYVVSIIDTVGSAPMLTLDLASAKPFSSALWRGPDGAELVLVVHLPPHGVEVVLYGIRSDGSGLRQIAIEDRQGDPVGAVTETASFQDVSLSPDGSSAIFWNLEPLEVRGRGASIHQLDLASGRDRRLFFDPTATAELRPVLSPDGTTIVFERQATGRLAQLMLARLDGSSPPRPLGPTFSYEDGLDVLLSPDGRTVLTVGKFNPAHLIDSTTGAVEETRLSITELPSWQRRAP